VTDEGELVALSSESEFTVRPTKKTYDAIIGVTASSSASLLGGTNGSSITVATVGRALTKVSTENGPIAIGDYITSSSKAGIGMKAAASGMVVGRALQAFASSSPDKILIQLEPADHLDLADLASSTNAMIASSTGSMIGDITDKITATLASSTSFVGTIASAVQTNIEKMGNWVVDKLTAHIVYTDRVEAKVVAVFEGIEMTDHKTGQTYCVGLSDGSWSVDKGACAVGTTTPDVTPVIPVENASSSTQGTTTPIVNNNNGVNSGNIGTSTVSTSTASVNTATSTSGTSSNSGGSNSSTVGTSSPQGQGGTTNTGGDQTGTTTVQVTPVINAGVGTGGDSNTAAVGSTSSDNSGVVPATPVTPADPGPAAAPAAPATPAADSGTGSGQ